MDAKSAIDKFARAAGFDGGAAWMHDNALMFVKMPDPLSYVDAVNWMYVRTEPMPKTEHGGAGTIVRAKSWEDLAARVRHALVEDSLYVQRSKIDKSSASAAEFMVECELLGLGSEEASGHG